ncbi:MAG: hypothetical protein ACP5E2_14530, partial [Terracidiphilus sp.]
PCFAPCAIQADLSSYSAACEVVPFQSAIRQSFSFMRLPCFGPSLRAKAGDSHGKMIINMDFLALRQ